MNFFTIIGLIVAIFFGLGIICGTIMFLIDKIKTLYMFYVKKKVRIDPMIVLFFGGGFEEIWTDREPNDKIVW